jgi:hypothetical protein
MIRIFDDIEQLQEGMRDSRCSCVYQYGEGNGSVELPPQKMEKPMGYLVGFLILVGLVVGMFAVVLGNRPLAILCAVMILASLILAVLDAFLASTRGVKGKQTTNWAALPRFVKKQKQDR